MTADTERILAQFATCANELRLLAVMLGPENNIGMFVTEIARYLEERRERWND